MRHDDRFYNHWYLRLPASIFAILCTISTVRYLWLDVSGDAPIAMLTQAICFLLAAAAIVYFIRPRLAHHVLLALTIFVLLVKGPDGPPAAVMFWLFVGVLLVLPYLAHRRPLTNG